MDDWDRMLNFQSQLYDNAVLTVNGFKAIEYIYGLARRLDLSFPSSPYMRSRFNSNSAYDWLIRFAKILEILQTYDNSIEKIKRIFSESFEVSLSAIYEVEVALRLHLNDLEIELPRAQPASKSPDIIVTINSKKYNIEVTTINYPQSVKRINYLYTEIQRLALQFKMNILGSSFQFINQVHSFILSIFFELISIKSTNFIKSF